MDRLIIELLSPHGHGVERRYVFEGGKATIGRSYSNDIILDDPFVCPKHLLVWRNGHGFFVKDLASENGTKIEGGAHLNGQSVKVTSRTEVCIGKTKLKFILPNHPVEPARRMGSLVALRQFLDRSFVAIGLSLLAAALAAWMVYVEEPGYRFWNSERLGAVVGYLAIAGCYAGAAGLICHVRLHRAYFKRHLAIFNIGMLIWIVYSSGEPFLMFWISNPGMLIVAKYFPTMVYMTAMFWASVRLTKDLVKWADLAKLASIALVLTLLSAWESKDIRFEFSGSPSYPANLAPYLEPLSELEPFEDFLEKSGPKLYKAIEK